VDRLLGRASAPALRLLADAMSVEITGPATVVETA
jgi:hypothetical protein